MRVLAKGENAPLTQSRPRVRVSCSGPGDVSALLLGPDGRISGDSDFVFYNQPAGTGVTVVESGLDLDLDAVPAHVGTIVCAVSVDDDQPAFVSGVTVRTTILDPAGAELFSFTTAEFVGERALVLVEIYRRAESWKVRAVGQGYEAGLAALAVAHGVDLEPMEAAALGNTSPGSASAPGNTSGPPPGARPSAPPPPGTTDPERQVRILTAIFEDAARSAAGYRSAVTFAEQRRDRELDVLVGDPRQRGADNPERAHIEGRYADLVTRATADHRRDVEQLAGELRVLTPSLPAALAPWDAAVWESGEFGVAAGIRAGELSLPEAPDLRIPLTLALPLRRPLWLLGGDSGGGADVLAMARSLIIRLLASDRSIRLHLCDTDGSLVAALATLAHPSAGVLGSGISTTREQRSETLRALAERVDLIEMARSAGALDELPMADSRSLLVVADVPTGFDEADHQRLRYLADCGPRAGLQMLLLGAPEPSDPSAELAQNSLLIGPDAGEGVSDGWVGLSWNFVPDLGPSDPAKIVFRR